MTATTSTSTAAPSASTTTDSAGSSAAANRARIAAEREAAKNGTSKPAESEPTPKADRKPRAAKPAAKSDAAPTFDPAKITARWEKGASIADIVKEFRTTRPAVRRAIYATLAKRVGGNAEAGKNEFHRLRATVGAGGSRKATNVVVPEPAPKAKRSGKSKDKTTAKS